MCGMGKGKSVCVPEIHINAHFDRTPSDYGGIHHANGSRTRGHEPEQISPTKTDDPTRATHFLDIIIPYIPK
jgi:hypothetical protein